MENSFSHEVIRVALEMSIKENLTENVKVAYNASANNYRISVWKKNFLIGVIATTQKQSVDEWNQTVKSFENYCSDLKKIVNAKNSQAHVTLMVLNDANLSQTLLTILDGTTIYNFQHDEKTMEGEE
ncbi:MAG: hypothetical protein K2H93_07710 [Oscillospiraceae bacterium]|nr:hypothetical protein [Oscillospiraceae bacterium]